MTKLAPFVLFIFLFASCKKEDAALSPFASTPHETVVSYDDQGRPTNMARDVISANLLSFIATNLPDGKDMRTSHPEYLNNPAIADIGVTKKSDIFITFISQATNSRNALAFYTYSSAAPPASVSDIKSFTYIFPNAGNNPPLQAGDKVKLGTFEAGISVGLVLLKDAWNPTAKKPDNNTVHFLSNDVLNPEADAALKKHAVLVPYNQNQENKILIGFEDVNRTLPNCDHDFSDLILYATVVNP
jgi:hypothetical protein